MLNRNGGLGFNDPVFAALYPPRRPAVPGIGGASVPTSDPPEAHQNLDPPHYTDLLRSEAMANPQMDPFAVSPGLAIGHPELNEHTLL